MKSGEWCGCGTNLLPGSDYPEEDGFNVFCGNAIGWDPVMVLCKNGKMPKMDVNRGLYQPNAIICP